LVIPAEVRKWLKFTHWQNGPPFKKRKKSEELEPALAFPEDCPHKTAGPTRQPLKIPNFGVRSAEIDALSGMIATIAERVVKRHMANHLRFKHSSEILHAEEEQQLSPIVIREPVYFRPLLEELVSCGRDG
jgi:hypothetical protein